jgi:hypothetical protein
MSELQDEAARGGYPQPDCPLSRRLFVWPHPPILDPLARSREDSLLVEFAQIEAELSQLQEALCSLSRGKPACHTEDGRSVADPLAQKHAGSDFKEQRRDLCGSPVSPNDLEALPIGPDLSGKRCLSKSEQKLASGSRVWNGVVWAFSVMCLSCGGVLLFLAWEDPRLGLIGVLSAILGLAALGLSGLMAPKTTSVEAKGQAVDCLGSGVPN